MKQSVRDKFIEDMELYIGADYDSSQEDFVLSLIESAIEEILSIIYPYSISAEKLETAENEVVSRYRRKILQIAQYHYDKQGKEGILSYTENGTQGTYENSGTPASYLRGIIPVSRVI